MTSIRTAAVIAALALLGSVVGAAGPASASTQTFPNSATLTTPADTTDLDITAIDVERTPSTVSLSLSVENLPDDNYSVTAWVLRAGTDINFVGTDALRITSTKINGVINPLVVQTRTNGGPFTTQAVGATSTIGAGRATLTVYPSSVPWTGDVWGYGTITVGGTTATVGYTNGGGIGGFGPVNDLPIVTATAVALSSSEQVFGRTSASITATVTPAAFGTLEFFDGATSLGSRNIITDAPTAVLALPNTLAIGDHSLHAVFTPGTQRTLASTSTSVTVRVVDPNAQPAPVASPVASPVPVPVATPAAVAIAKAPTKTSSKLTLSKTRQHYKGKPSKLTVKVSGKHAGRVRIYDGSHKLKTLTLKAGRASYTLSATLTRRTHTLTAVYVPADPSSFASSTSKKVKLTVVQ